MSAQAPILTLRHGVSDAAADAEDRHARLLQHVATENETLRRGVFVRSLDAPTAGDAPSDSPSHSLVLDKSGVPLGVLFLSSPVNPVLVQRGVENARTARQLLGPDLGSVVLEPLAEGMFENLSYALWPWRRPLSASRPVQAIQKRILRSRILRWMREAAAQTLRSVPESDYAEAYLRPLETVRENTSFPASMRLAADEAILRLRDREWQPSYVLEHGDWWYGNVLLPAWRAPKGEYARGFVLIDWGGMRSQGYPFIDLLRFARSARLSRPALRHEIRELCGVLGCQAADVRSYLLAGLGALALNLEHFPWDRFRTMAVSLCDDLDQALPKSTHP